MLREQADWFDAALDEALDRHEPHANGRGPERFTDFPAIVDHERWPGGLLLTPARQPGLPEAHFRADGFVDILQVLYDRWEPYVPPVYLAVYSGAEADAYRFRVIHDREAVGDAPFGPPVSLDEALELLVEAFVAADPGYDRWLLQFVQTARRRGLVA